MLVFVAHCSAMFTSCIGRLSGTHVSCVLYYVSCMCISCAVNQAYYILDELFIGGELQESSKKEVLRVCSQLDDLMEEKQEEGSGSTSRTRR